MSVVARQGFKYSIIGYLSFLLGTVSALFIFPFDMVFYGKLRYVLPTAQLLLPIVVFGLSYSNIKFFSDAQKVGKHQNLLSLSLVGILINFVLFCAGFFVFYSIFPSQKNTELWRMKRLILPLILVLAISVVYNRYLSNYKRIVIPNIFENVFPKIANLGAFCFFVFIGISEKLSYGFFLLIFVLGMFSYAFYTNKLEKFTPDFTTTYFKKNGLAKDFFWYSFFGFLGNLGSYLALNIDNYMIGEHLNFEENGIYSTIYAIVSLISIPALGLYNISAPIINKHFSDDTISELDKYYKKTSLNLFFLGLVLFSCLVIGFPFLAEYMPKNGKQLLEAEPLIWILGIAILFDLSTAFNSHFISLSKYYKFNIVMMLFLAILTIGLNLYFIKNTSLGIMGIAIAYGVSLTLFNIAKIIFNFMKFKVSPFTIEMIYTIIIGSMAITVAILLPNFENNFLNLIYKPALVLTMFFIGNYFLKIIPLENYFNKAFIKSILKF